MKSKRGSAWIWILIIIVIIAIGMGIYFLLSGGDTSPANGNSGILEHIPNPPALPD